jgi:hypothetical protein
VTTSRECVKIWQLLPEVKLVKTVDILKDYDEDKIDDENKEGGDEN